MRKFENLKSQIVISSWGGMRRAKPYAFTEQGVAMLSSVLRSKRAVQVSRQADHEESEKLKRWASGIILSLGLDSEMEENEGKSFMPTDIF